MFNSHILQLAIKAKSDARKAMEFWKGRIEFWEGYQSERSAEAITIAKGCYYRNMARIAVWNRCARKTMAKGMVE